MTTVTRSTRARRALAILTLDTIQEPATRGEEQMREAAQVAYQADLRAKEAAALADAAPTREFVVGAESARRTAEAAEAAAQRVYRQFGGVVRRRDAAEREIARLDEIEAEAARWLDAARDAHLWA